MRKILVPAIFCVMACLGAGSAQAQTATQDINLTANVASYCTINNAVTGTVINAAIPVTNGIVDVTPIPNTIASVACNNLADVVATSLSGGVTTGTAPVSGATNIINYTGVATFGGATSTINTGTAVGAAGNEAGNTATTTGAATGDLVVTITPAQPALPLTPSTAYADTLRVTLTAQ
ncbi:MAG: hypothetical protein ABL893_18380 [Hyphomicrobium sp.]|nr:hypothetical protein [Hyphomicrobium sp.]